MMIQIMKLRKKIFEAPMKEVWDLSLKMKLATQAILRMYQKWKKMKIL